MFLLNCLFLYDIDFFIFKKNILKKKFKMYRMSKNKLIFAFQN